MPSASGFDLSKCKKCQSTTGLRIVTCLTRTYRPSGVAQHEIVEYRRLVNSFPEMRRMHNCFDEYVGNLCELEKEHGIIQKLWPHGPWANHRKTWSYGGALADARDPSNWIYAVVLRSMLYNRPWIPADLSDELLGDHFEAILHLGHNEGHPQCLLYARELCRVCPLMEQMRLWQRSMHFDCCSRTVANLML